MIEELYTALTGYAATRPIREARGTVMPQHNASTLRRFLHPRGSKLYFHIYPPDDEIIAAVTFFTPKRGSRPKFMRLVQRQGGSLTIEDARGGQLNPAKVLPPILEFLSQENMLVERPKR